MATIDTAVRNVWIKGFWGFDPSNGGYIGFTHESNRDRFVREITSDDLVLIYGTDSPETETKNRTQPLGFLQIAPTPIMKYERQSEIDRLRNTERGTQDRWIFAVPVKRAWKVVNHKIPIQHLARHTYSTNNPRITASQGRKLTPEEVQTVLQLEVSEISVFGEPPILSTKEAPMREVFAPSRGVNPTFGIRTSEYQDGVHYLYMLRYEGDPLPILGPSFGSLHNKTLVKVGMSNDPSARCAQMNDGFPPAAISKWKQWVKSKAFKDGDTAKKAEDFLKDAFDKKIQSLGGEFFIGPTDEMESIFVSASAPTAFIIKA
jgi:hypothetical protein